MKIKRLNIHSFRGIPEELTIDFFDKNDKPISAIISGDNGSGKSSIVDAIEYNLQGRISRESLVISSESRTPISYKHTPIKGCKTIVLLDNGVEHKRGITIKKNEEGIEFVYDNKIILKEFSITPIALRRSDIISFGIIPKSRRQLLLSSFLYQKYTTIEEVIRNSVHWEGDEYIKSMTEKYVKLKQERKNKVNEIALLLNVPPKTIPYGTKKEITTFIYSKLSLKGFYTGKKGEKIVRLNKKGEKENKILELVEDILSLIDKIKKIKNETEYALNPGTYGLSLQEIKVQNAQFLNKASVFLSQSFKEISNLDFVDEILIKVGNQTSVSLEIIVKLKNGKISTPNQLFSEANYDLLVLLLFISLIRSGAELGQAKVIIFDDVLQSVDSVIRSKFMDYIFRVCKDWQIIITCHDDLWVNQLRFLFNRNNFPYLEYKLSNWTFEHGPKIIKMKESGEDLSLKEALKTNDKQIIASQAGLFFEKLCQKLSVSLPISVKRTPDDKYTIGDLWPGIVKALKNVTELKELLNELDRELMVRNLLGCHANEWSLSMSEKEVMSFANNVQALYEKVFCTSCQNWITTRNCIGKYLAECKCRNIQFLKG